MKDLIYYRKRVLAVRRRWLDLGRSELGRWARVKAIGEYMEAKRRAERSQEHRRASKAFSRAHERAEA